MTQFIRVGGVAELPEVDSAKEFHCGARTICMANVNGVYSAMENVCLHRGGPLGQGMVEGDKVICPWHGWAWDTKTGVADQDSRMKIAVYPVKIEDGDVMIEI